MITKNRVDIRKSAEEGSKSLFLKGEHMKTIIHDLDKFYDCIFDWSYKRLCRIYCAGRENTDCWGCVK